MTNQATNGTIKLDGETSSSDRGIETRDGLEIKIIIRQASLNDQRIETREGLELKIIIRQATSKFKRLF